MNRVAVLGVGQTPFRRQPEVSVERLTQDAVRRAVADAGIGLGDIQAAMAGSVTLHGGVGQRCLKDLGLAGIPMVNVENACSSGSTALREACAWVGAGLVDVALAVGVDNLSQAFGRAGLGGADLDLDHPVGVGMGLPVSGLYALEATRYFAEYGAGPEDLARVAVKNRANAVANPYAYHRSPVTLEEVVAAKMICDPITKLGCCPNADGAAACIVASAAAAKRIGHRGGVWITGSGMGSGRLMDRPELLRRATETVSRQAYEMAGIGPEDVDVVELHDAFAISEWLYLEDLGLAKPGTAWSDSAAGAFDRDGRVAVNAGGGLLGRGHPMGPTGLAQICELTWQLRGEAEGRQVQGARVGVAHTMGGNQFDLECNACLVHVLTR